MMETLSPVIRSSEIIELQDLVPNIKVDPAIIDYILDLVEATRHDEQLHLGISPRGGLALVRSPRNA